MQSNERDGPIVRVVRSISPGESRRAHLPWAVLAATAWWASFLIPYQTPLRLCIFLNWTGYPCMFCGWTRSMSALSQGAWSFAIHNAPVVLVLYAGMIGVLLWNTAGFVTNNVLQPGYLLRRIRIRSILMALPVLILLNWLYRLRLGMT